MESMTDCAFSWPISSLVSYHLSQCASAPRTLVVLDHISQMISAGVVSFPH